MSSLSISIQPKHIEQGQPKAANLCAFALAVHDHVPGLSHVSVGPAGVWLIYGDQPSDPSIRYAPTPELLAWVKRFDQGKPVEPLSVTLKQEPLSRWNPAEVTT